MIKPFVLPGQPTKYARNRQFQILHTKLEVELDFERKEIRGKATHLIKALGVRPLSTVELDAAEMNFHAVKAGGKEASYSTLPRSIRISLDEEIESGRTTEIEIEYSAIPSRGLYFREPSEKFPNRPTHAFTQGQAEDSKYWFPCYDYPNMRASTEVIVKAPSNMVAISNGKLVSHESVDQGKKKLWHFRQEEPHSSYLVSLIVGEYDRIEEVHDGVLLEYFVFRDRKNEAGRSFSKTPKMFDFFKRVTGQKYPYPKYSQTVVSDYMFGGMENTTATTLTERTLHDERAHLDFKSDYLVSHELAHQWFGDYVTCKDWSHAWLNEGFATYFCALFEEHDQGPDDFQYFMNGNREALDDEVSEHYARPVATKRYWDPEELFDHHTYEKGSWVLNALRGYLGDEVFFSGIRSYVAKNRLSLVETSDFRKAMEETSGIDLESFFEQWVYNPGYPEYSARYNWDARRREATLEIEQTNAESEGVPLFTTPIEVRFSFEGEEAPVSRRIVMAGKKSTFSFSFERQPANVNIDPKNWILKKLAFEKPKEMSMYQLKNDGDAMERVRACWELSKFRNDDQVVDALAFALDNDRFWGVRLEAASSLGKLESRRALEAILSRKGSKDHKVRRGIAIGLRNFANLEADAELAVEALKGYVENDESYYVRAFASQSLGYFKKSDNALKVMLSALEQESINDQVRYRTFLGIGERKDPRALPEAMEHLRNGREFQDKVGAAFAIGRIGRGRPDALDALLAAQSDPDVRVRAEAASAIFHLGDPSSVPALERWLSGEDHGRVRRRLRETIFFLNEGRPQKEQLEKVREDLDKVKEENKRLGDRLALLESRKS